MLPPTEVMTESGPVSGLVLESGLYAYLGIPYAAAPTGERRWREPVPHARWNETLQAVQYGPSCIQVNLSSILTVTYMPQSEDCLSLNIWTPSLTDSLPVLVFVHGGGFMVGSSADPTLDGSSISQNGPSVVVTLNYRLGGFGFLALPDLAAEDVLHNSTGMYGLMDQQLALKWVKANIANFGGDPSRVMLFGQSAGGNSMFIHLVSESSRGLFSSMAIESGYYRGYNSLPDAFSLAEPLLASSGCSMSSDVLGCLRALSAEDVLSSTGSCQWLPVIDGYVLRDYADILVQKGLFNKVPVLMGGVRNEGTITVDSVFGDSFGVAMYNTYTLALYSPLVGPAEANRVVKEYRPAQYDAYTHTYPGSSSSYWCLSSSFGDFNILCPSAHFGDLLAAQGVDVYLFVFSYPPTSNGYYRMKDPLGAYHASEVPFIWHTFLNFTAAEDDLSFAIQGAWNAFAANGNPGSIGSLPWPKWVGGSSSQNMDFNLACSIDTYLDIADRCAFWDAQPIYTPQVVLGGCTL